MPYPRDQLISELLSYYEFLIRLYVSPDQLKLPPKGGWLTITPERFSALRKNDHVIDILKHAPYISSCPFSGDVSEFLDECICVDYSDLECQESIVRYQDLEYCADPGDLLDADDELAWVRDAHIVALGRSPAVDKGHWLFCDTKTGVVFFVDFMHGSFQTYADPAVFFAGLKNDFNTLRMAPIPSLTRFKVADPEGNLGRGMGDKIKDIFRKHGWPSGDYRKEECLAQLRALREW